MSNVSAFMVDIDSSHRREIAVPNSAYRQMESISKNLAPFLQGLRASLVSHQRNFNPDPWIRAAENITRVANKLQATAVKLDSFTIPQVNVSSDTMDSVDDAPAMDVVFNSDVALNTDTPSSPAIASDILEQPQNKYWKQLLWNEKGSGKEWIKHIGLLLRDKFDRFLVYAIITLIVVPSALFLLNWLGLLHLVKDFI